VSSLPQTTVRETTVRATLDGNGVRARILDAAERVFAERGYAGATTREIALAARIHKRMLFYYFPTKDVLYRAVLERIVANLIAIHERFRNDPGPVGLGEAAEGLVAFAAANLGALKLLHREIMDAGPHLAGLAREHLGPLFARGAAEVERNVTRGLFRSGDPMHTLVNVGGLTLYYFLLVPLLAQVWDRDPLASSTLAERAAMVRECLLHGLAGPAARGGMPP
jgi:TetR/AcrR family transcriptional regulator